MAAGVGFDGEKRRDCSCWGRCGGAVKKTPQNSVGTCSSLMLAAVHQWGEARALDRKTEN